MIGIDTNVLIRAFARDEPRQGASATRLIDGAEAATIFINVIVLVEFAWTLRRAYKRDDAWIRQAVTQIVRHPAFVIQHRDSVLEAISKSNAVIDGFADRLIGALNRDAGCATTMTFDREAARHRDFRELPS